MRTLRGGSPKSRKHATYQLNVVKDGQRKKPGSKEYSETGFRVIMVIIIGLLFLQSCQ